MHRLPIYNSVGIDTLDCSDYSAAQTKIGIQLAPFTLAPVLGNRAEDAFRLSMIGSGGDLKVKMASSARSRRLRSCCCSGH